MEHQELPPVKTTVPKSLHVIFGAGPVGCWTARALRDLNISVRAANRSGRRPELMPNEVEMVEKACRALGFRPQFTVVSPLMMRLVGLFNPGAGESVEMMYEFTDPFEVDSSRMQRTFSLAPTPVDVAMRRTMEWYRSSASGS